MNEIVSVIIPVYNGQEFIKKTIESCLIQTYNALEIIVVDDCSTDESFCIASDLYKKDDRIKLLKNEVNMGFCGSCNRAIGVSVGKYILVLGQDDLLVPNHIESMVSVFREDTVLVWCGSEYIDTEDNVIKTKKISNTDPTIKDFIIANPISSCGLLMKKEAMIKAGMYPVFPSFSNYGEWYSWIKMKGTGQFLFNQNVRSLYRRHSENISNGFKTKQTKLKLYQYWNKCRRECLHIKGIKLYDRLLVFWYIIKDFAKYLVTRVLVCFEHK